MASNGPPQHTGPVIPPCNGQAAPQVGPLPIPYGHSSAAPSAQQQQNPDWFLSLYRAGKTIGCGSFGKVRNVVSACGHEMRSHGRATATQADGVSIFPYVEGSHGCLLRVWRLFGCVLQVKVAEHVLTGHKVAIKILNR